MTPSLLSSRSALCSAVLLVLASTATARDLGHFDANWTPAPSSNGTIAKRSPAVIGPPGADALGRETFTWVQQDLPARAKAMGPIDDEAAARAHLIRLLGAAKRSGDTASSLSLHKVDAQPGGARLVQFVPRIGGVPIFHENLALLLDREQRLVAMRGPLPQTSTGAAKSLPEFRLDAAQAVAVALGAHDFDADIAKHLSASKAHGEYRHFTLDSRLRSHSGAVSAGEQRAKPVYYRTRDGLLPAWYVETAVADSPTTAADAYAFVISAIDGALLFRINQTSHASAYTYRVWAEADGHPHPSPQGRALMPDPDGLPTDDAAPLIAQTQLTLANAPFSRSATDAWLPPGATTTSGNNVSAFADLAEPSGFGAGDRQPSLTSSTSFVFAYDPLQAPDANPTQIDASTVQAFYWMNWLHDWFYDHGFTEADGNAQADNYGRGGLGGDAIVLSSHSHDVAGNATMSTRADGASPRARMGTADGTTFALDGHVTAHEWGHYMSDRLVGDASGLDSTNARGMGEGWSDFISLLTTVRAEDEQRIANRSFSGAYGQGAYSTGSYYGFRRYPYSTDMTKNPLTLRHIANGVALPTAPAPAFTGSNAQIHAQGTIWANTLWEAYVSLLNDRDRLSFDEAQRRMKDYLVGGLKLTPVSPTMIEARDAILATILANDAAEDFALFTAAFAKRGLGAGAVIPDRYSTTMAGTIESMAIGGSVEVQSVELGVATGCDTDGVLDAGETAELQLTVRNSGFTPLASATVTLSSNDPAIEFPAGTVVDVGALPLFGAATVTVPIALAGNPGTRAAIDLTATAASAGVSPGPAASRSLQAFVNFDEAPRETALEEFDTSSTGWTRVRDPAGSGSTSWTLEQVGDTRVMHGSDSHLEGISWIESPVMAVGDGPLTVAMVNRYQFETDYDGGVIQTSIDGGASWNDLDRETAGYALEPLPDCCGNPRAGLQAITGTNQAYPGFNRRTLHLGTTYANQTRFKLRFGVATDASVSLGGWDIDRVEITGLVDTPFDIVIPQAAECSVAAGKTLQGAMSGTYYTEDRSGEGVLVDFGKIGDSPIVFFSWYTYEQGEQQWLVGASPFALTDTSVTVDVMNSSGTGFGSEFRAEDVVRSPWGSVAMSFPDCDTMQLTYRKSGGESGTLVLDRGLERLDAGQCNLLQGGLTGTYYAEERSGEGVLVDFGRVGATPVEFLSWYTYDGGAQKWLVGTQVFSPTDSSLVIDLMETRGANFGQAFDAADVERLPWGTVSQRFLDCETIELTYRKTGGETGTLVMSRGLQRLGDGQCR